MSHDYIIWAVIGAPAAIFMYGAIARAHVPRAWSPYVFLACNVSIFVALAWMYSLAMGANAVDRALGRTKFVMYSEQFMLLPPFQAYVFGSLVGAMLGVCVVNIRRWKSA